jgi:hypothetical protein
MQIQIEQGGPELAFAGLIRTILSYAAKLGEHIVRDYELPKSMEGALQLLVIYNQIFTAKKMNAYLVGNIGYFDILDCTHWDLLCGPLGINCDENCESHEIPSVLKVLGDFDVKLVKCKPRGGDRCSWEITKN